MSDVRYTKSHEWCANLGEEMCVGITHHAQELLGDLVFVELPEVGRVVKLGEEIAVVESVKAASDVYAPMSGVITAINTKLIADPALINQDPEGEAWLFKFKPSEMDEFSQLLSGNSYQQEIA